MCASFVGTANGKWKMGESIVKDDAGRGDWGSIPLGRIVIREIFHLRKKKRPHHPRPSLHESQKVTVMRKMQNS